MATPPPIQKLALDRAKSDERASGGTLHYVPPTTTEVLHSACDEAMGTTAVWFVFDFVILHRVQSGSDSYTHHVYAGCATLRGDEVIDSSLELLRQDDVTEHALDWAPQDQRYRPNAVRSADRDAWWSKQRAPLRR